MLLSSRGRIIGTDDVSHEVAAWTEIEGDCEGEKGKASVRVIQDGNALTLRVYAEISGKVAVKAISEMMDMPVEQGAEELRGSALLSVQLDREAAEELGWYLIEWARTGLLPTHPYLGEASQGAAGRMPARQ